MKPNGNEAFLQTILSSIADGVFSVDRDWRITSFNPAAERITGVPAEQAIGKRCSDVFHADLCERGCALRESVETGKNLVYGLTRDASWRPIQLSDLENLTVSDELLKKVEIKHDSDLLGYLNVYFTKKFVKEKLTQYLVKIFIEILLLIAILTLINIVLLQKLLIRPIKTLQLFAEKIKGGNLEGIFRFSDHFTIEVEAGYVCYASVRTVGIRVRYDHVIGLIVF